jgi:2-succinyl-5-enolpyruvyl-6-hydroxy-3-cyclohexene-1-carboxylate synthase
MDKKLELWESQLPLDKLALIAFASKRDVDHEVNLRVDKQVYTINQALETSIAAALFDSTDLNIEEVEKIISKSNEYMKSSEEFLIKYGEDWIMKINEIKPRIKDESIKLLDKNKNQADAVKALKEIFKDIPTKDLVNIFKETKEEWCRKCPTIEKGNKAKLGEKEENQVSTPKKENKSIMEAIENQNNTFEVVEKKLKFKGKYHDYEKDKNGLVVGIEIFKSLDEIEAFRIKETKEFEKMISEITLAFNFEG